MRIGSPNGWCACVLRDIVKHMSLPWNQDSAGADTYERFLLPSAVTLEPIEPTKGLEGAKADPVEDLQATEPSEDTTVPSTEPSKPNNNFRNPVKGYDRSYKGLACSD